MNFFPASITMIIEEIKGIKGSMVCCDNAKKEMEIYAPYPGEVDEKEEQKAFELMGNLEKEFKTNNFMFESFRRGEGIDAIRIRLQQGEEKI